MKLVEIWVAHAACPPLGIAEDMRHIGVVFEFVALLAQPPRLCSETLRVEDVILTVLRL